MSGYYTQQKWRNRDQYLGTRIPRSIYHWLFDTGSLTAKIIESCSGDFRVHLISQKIMTPTPDEIRTLNLRYRSRAIIRQVVLYCDDKPWVYARSVIPVTSLVGSLRRLARLGNKPLGAVLFSDRSISRGEVEVAIVDSMHESHTWKSDNAKQPIWARRSVFYKQSKKLLVSEFFLFDIATKKE